MSQAATNMIFASETIAPADEAVIGSASVGNRELEDLAELFREHYKGIFSVAYRVTGSQSDAEDVLQTIFMRLTRGWSERDLSPNSKAFLYRSAVNASLDLLRQRKRSNSISLDVIEPDQTPRHTAASPEDNVVDMELRDLIRQAVAKLEGRAASAFALRYYEGYDNSQIAEILGTSQLVIGVTLHRARTRLRKEIGAYLEKHHEEK